MSLSIIASSTVELHFSVALENGDLVDSTFGHKAASFTMGDGSLLDGFENKLIGLKAGDKAEFLIKPEEGFGSHNPENIQYFKRKTFAADIELEEGMIMSFADASGSELPGVIKGFDDQEVEVDFNHPLAGREITFTVEIIDVK